MNRFSDEAFESLPIVAILRGAALEQLPFLVEACLKGGLTNLEITMNSPGAPEQISRAREVAGPSMNIGAGTVISPDLLRTALEAGASFVVTPTVTEDVIRECREKNVPVFPGALTPTEVCRAWELGARMVKVFPADKVGPGYIKNLRAPFPNIRLMPTGGVDLQTIELFYKAGADGFGVGTPLFHPARVKSGDWVWLRNQAAAFREKYRQLAPCG